VNVSSRSLKIGFFDKINYSMIVNRHCYMQEDQIQSADDSGIKQHTPSNTQCGHLVVTGVLCNTDKYDPIISQKTQADNKSYRTKSR